MNKLLAYLGVCMSLVSMAADLVWAESLPKGLIGGLSSDTFNEREQAHLKLSEWASKNLKNSPEILYRAWKVSDDPEAKTRLYSMMREMVTQRRYGRGKGFVGIKMEEFMAPGQQGGNPRAGVKVSLVLEDTPAAKAGLKVGDVILGVDDINFSDANPAPQRRAFGAFRVGSILKFSDYIQSKQPGDRVTLHLLRQDKKIDLHITLMKRPASADTGFFEDQRSRDEKLKADKFFKDWLKEMEAC